MQQTTNGSVITLHYPCLSGELEYIQKQKAAGFGWVRIAKECNNKFWNGANVRTRKTLRSIYNYHKTKGLIDAANKPHKVASHALTRELIKVVSKDDGTSIYWLSDTFGHPVEAITEAITYLQNEGYDLEVEKDKVYLRKTREQRFEPTIIVPKKKNEVTLGIVSDTHLVSKWQQLSLLHSAFKHFDEVGVDAVAHVGDINEGRNMYKGHAEHVFLHGYDESRIYVEKNFPRLKDGKKIYIVTGNHDYSWYNAFGASFMKALCATRDDFVWVGDAIGSLNIGGLRVEMMHPTGGSAYAYSYKPQKLTESLVASLLQRYRIGKAQLPHIALYGHWHIKLQLEVMGVECFAAGCFQTQTPYMAHKGLHPHIGYWIIKAVLDETDQICELVSQWFPRGHLTKEYDY